MANWCNCYITLSGNYKPFMKKLEKHNWYEDGFELPDDQYIVDYENLGEENRFKFESKYVAPLTGLVIKATRCKFSFEISYEEFGYQIYGKAIFNHITSEYKEWNLPEKIFQLCYDDNEDFDYEKLDDQLELLMKNYPDGTK